MTDYTQIQNLAIETAKSLPPEKAHEMIADSFWLALSLLYQEMVKRKEINSLFEIGRDKLLLYWTQACLGNKDRSILKLICAMQALYMYDLIQDNDKTNS